MSKKQSGGVKAPHNYPAHRQPTGPRPQAGRPAKLANPKRVTLWLEEEQLAWVLSQGDKSEVIRRLIAEAMSKTVQLTSGSS